MPVVYVAVGRRLGYPLKLVAAAGMTAGHLFARWEEKRERFNIEATAQGLNCFPDDYYRTGRYQLPPGEEEKGCLLRSMTPREELSGFVAGRGFHCLDAGNLRQAADAFAWAFALQPDNKHKLKRLLTTCERWAVDLKAIEPPGFPEMRHCWPPRRFPDPFPDKLERDILGLEAWDNVLRDPRHEQQWWAPMRRREPMPTKPTKCRIVWNATGCEIGLECHPTVAR
jgi:hypothetical protein